MKNFLFLSFVFALMSFGTLSAQTPDPNPDLDFDVDINPGKSPIPTIKPKTIVYEEIEAHYSSMVLSFVFNADLGNAHIVVTNTTTGESWYDSVNGVGVTSIMLSGDEGYYEIYIYTDRGDYNGEFVI
ncbi:MAG: DUF3244 domain-containing protein [Alistipes sp.]|nr:DUF3244 domain-containing protein [Alistipes sp.]